MMMTGARIILETLLEEGLDTVFGYPGGAVLNLYDELYKIGGRMTHYMTCHEQAAAHAADAYARVTGKVGVVFATSGPGATNLVTGIATAYLDSSPLVAVTGNVGTPLIGKDSFQEVDITGITMPITKHNYMVRDVGCLADTVREAIKIAASGRPGPVLVDVPKDIQAAVADYIPRAKPRQKKVRRASDAEIDEAVTLIRQAERPFIYAGGGVVSADACRELRDFADLIDAPVGLSMMGLTAMPNTNPRNLGMTGMHGRYAASMVMSQSDLIIAVGTRFSDRATGSRRAFAEGRRILHIDIDPAEIGKNIPAYVSVIGDLKDALGRLCDLGPEIEAKRPEWQKTIAQYRLDEAGHNKEICAAPRGGGVSPQSVIKAVKEFCGEGGIVATDVGQHQMWVSQSYPFDNPRTFVTSGGLGTMGFGMGAAIGACVAGGGKRRTALFTGDGSFHMNMNELATAVAYSLPITVIVMNNGVLGMVRQWQSMFYDGRYSSTTHGRRTDFVKLAEAFGAEGTRITREEEIIPSLKQAWSASGPFVIDAAIWRDEMVLPMIPPGGTINDIIIRG